MNRAHSSGLLRLLYLVQLVVLWAGFASTARADDVRPAYLEVREVRPGRYEVLWKTPMREGARLRLAPRFPDGVRAVPGSYERQVLSDALIERWQLEAEVDLAGREIGIEGLELTLRDVIVRVRFRDGRSHDALLRATRPAFLVPEPGGAGPALPARLRDAVLGGIDHLLREPLHVLLPLAVGLALGLRALGGALLAFVLMHLLGVVAGRAAGVGPPMLLAELMLGVGAAVVAAVAARKVPSGGSWRLAAIAGLLGLSHGSALAGAAGDASLGELLVATVGIDIAQLAVCLLGLGVAQLVWRVAPRVPRRAPAYVVGAAAFGLALWNGVGMAAAVEAAPEPSLAGLPGTLTAVRTPLQAATASRAAVAPMKAPVEAWLDVGPFEVRLEVLARLDVLDRWFGLELSDRETIAVAEQAALIDRVTAQLRQNLAVRIDRQEQDALTVRCGFAAVDATGRYLRTESIPETTATAVVGVVWAFSTPGVPGDVEVTWRALPPGMPEVPMRAIDPESVADFAISDGAPVLHWRNELRDDPLPSVDAVAVEVVELQAPILSLLGALAALGLLGWSARRGRARRGGVAARLLLGAACAVAPVWVVAVPMPGSQERVPDERETSAMAQALLRNVYRAFDYRDEDAIYDRLAVSVQGDLLTEIYLEHRRGLEIERTGGARARVAAVELIAAQSIEAATAGGFSAELEWTVAGSVTHFGHRHFRQNGYRAVLRFVPRQGAWKIADLELLEESRLR